MNTDLSKAIDKHVMPVAREYAKKGGVKSFYAPNGTLVTFDQDGKLKTEDHKEYKGNDLRPFGFQNPN